MVIYLFEPPDNLSKVLQSLIRMKWFFISILLVYLMLDKSSADIVSRITEGVGRIMVLVIMMLLVSWLMDRTPRDQILAGLIYLLKPVQMIGFPIHKFAIRVELIFQEIDFAQHLVNQKKAALLDKKLNYSEIANVLSGLYHEIVACADHSRSEPVAIDLIERVSPIQWMFPFFLFAILLIIHNLS